MSDQPTDKPFDASQKAPPSPPDWLDELRERLAGWIGALFPPPEPEMMPVPVPVRRRS